MVHHCIRIELTRLRARLSRDQGHDMELFEVQQWLERMGFTRRGDWHCDDDALRNLRANEILSERELDENGGVTSVE